MEEKAKGGTPKDAGRTKGRSREHRTWLPAGKGRPASTDQAKKQRNVQQEASDAKSGVRNAGLVLRR